MYVVHEFMTLIVCVCLLVFFFFGSLRLDLAIADVA